MDQLKIAQKVGVSVLKITPSSSHSPGLQSVNNEQIDKRTFDIVNAGDQLSFNMSKQITP
jgi:hypothetical protein